MKTAHDLVTSAKSQIQEIAVDAAENAIRAADVLIDVREPDEFAAGHLPGAVHVPRGLLEFRFSADPALQSRDLSIVLYCKTSGRAALAALALKSMGYLKVQSIAGGFDAWAGSGRPVARPPTVEFE
ncbi:MAG: hypothetical protein Fur007_12040 [Rhodoferax sp.]